MFTTPCFIRKNTPELRKKLEELGYKPFGSVKYEWDTGWGLSTDNRLGEFESFDNNGLENIIKCESPDYEDSIDCGDNEELFIALAALRDDKPDYQWFLWEDNDGIYHTELEDSWRKYIPNEKWEEWWWFEVRKATVEEIIEHFKEE